MYTPTTPQVIQIRAMLPSGTSVVVEKTIDRYELDGYEFSRDQDDLALSTLRIRWSRGYTEAGKFVATDHIESRFGGHADPEDAGDGSSVALVMVLGQMVSPGATRYDDIRNGLWQLLLDSKKIPPGTVT